MACSDARNQCRVMQPSYLLEQLTRDRVELGVVAKHKVAASPLERHLCALRNGLDSACLLKHDAFEVVRIDRLPLAVVPDFRDFPAIRHDTGILQLAGQALRARLTPELL